MKSVSGPRSALQLFRQNPWVEGIQMWTCLWFVLGPMPSGRATWSDSDSNGSNDTWTDAQTQVVTTVADMNTVNTDADADGATNAEEAAEGSNPYVFDTDYDGISDGDELHLARQVISNISLTNWDSDGDFVSDYDEFRGFSGVSYLNGQLPAHLGASYSDYDGDGYKNPDDPAPEDPTNYSGYNSISWYGNAMSDNDSDGTVNWYDSSPSPPSDGDGDGIDDFNDPFPSDSTNYSSFNGIAWYSNLFGDDDGDLSLNWEDSHPYPDDD